MMSNCLFSLIRLSIPLELRIYFPNYDIFRRLVGFLEREICLSQGLYFTSTRLHNTVKCRYTFMPRVAFKFTITVFDHFKGGHHWTVWSPYEDILSLYILTK
jgi:hypothetical protein